MTAPIPRDVYSAATIARFYKRGYWTDDTLADFLDRRAAEAPGRSLLLDGDDVWTNAAVRAATYRIAARLRAGGLRTGERVAVQLPPWPEYVLTYFALARLGAVLVPLMPIYRQKEVGYILRVTDAAMYVGTSGADVDHLAMVREMWPNLPALRQLVTVRAAPRAGEAAFDELASGDHVPDEAELGPRPHPDAVHLIGFTSGTESAPKGCVHTWNSYSFTPRTQRKLYGVTDDDVELVVSPPTHTSGLAAGILKPLVSGAAASLMPKWAPEAALDLIARHRATMATGATPFITMLADAYDPGRHDVSSFRMFACGGAPVPAALISKVRATLGHTAVLPVYGQTESLILTTCRPDDTDERAAASSGYAVPGVRVEIRDVGGTSVPARVVGEIVYQTPGGMLGYWANPQATAAVIGADGWRHSGDLGFLDDNGYLQITGRLKDMIIRGGVNISAREVEEMLERHPRVGQAAVVGVPDARLGERIGAFVVTTDGAGLTVEDVAQFLLERFGVAKQKLPEVVHVLPRLPMTATGKVSKRELRDLVDPIVV